MDQSLRSPGRAWRCKHRELSSCITSHETVWGVPAVFRLEFRQFGLGLKVRGVLKRERSCWKNEPIRPSSSTASHPCTSPRVWATQKLLKAPRSDWFRVQGVGFKVYRARVTSVVKDVYKEPRLMITEKVD